ncbi:MAG: type 4a pilus biogenesis protein PilO [Fuerstiella sp.]
MFLNQAERKLATWSWMFHACGAVITVAVLCTTVLLLLRPMENRVVQLRHRATELSAALAKEDAVKAEHQQLTARRLEADDKIEKLLDRIPNVPRESDFLGQITTLAAEVGLSIIDYRPGTATEGKGYQQMTLTLSSDGSYESVCRFLNRIDQLPRLTRVLTLDITPLADDTGCKMLMTLTIYFAPDSKLPLADLDRHHA